MATHAHVRALALREDDGPVAGVASTAALATDRDRRGADRAHLAVVMNGATLAAEVHMDRADGREAQERQVSDAVLEIVARACGA